MKVTIELGERAMELVASIPEDEIPTILSDVLERSLEEELKRNCNKSISDDVLDKINLLISNFSNGNIGIPNNFIPNTSPMEIAESGFSKKREVVIESVEENKEMTEDDFLDFSNFMR